MAGDTVPAGSTRQRREALAERRSRTFPTCRHVPAASRCCGRSQPAAPCDPGRFTTQDTAGLPAPRRGGCSL